MNGRPITTRALRALPGQWQKSRARAHACTAGRCVCGGCGTKGVGTPDPRLLQRRVAA